MKEITEIPADRGKRRCGGFGSCFGPRSGAGGVVLRGEGRVRCPGQRDGRLRPRPGVGYLRSDFWNIRSDFSDAALAALAADLASAAAC